MQINAVKTARFNPGENLSDFVLNHLSDIAEGQIIVITSKLVSLAQNRIVHESSADKDDLISSEADKILKTDKNLYGVHITLKDGIMIASAGIDASNSDGHYILYPKNIRAAARDLWHDISNARDLQNFGILITDSHTSPLRRGITGFALSWWGIDPIHNYKGAPDIYDKPLEYSETNVVDSLASAAVFTMGEANEQCPVAIIKDAPKVRFLNIDDENYATAKMEIPMEDDLYAPLFTAVDWIE